MKMVKRIKFIADLICTLSFLLMVLSPITIIWLGFIGFKIMGTLFFIIIGSSLVSYIFKTTIKEIDNSNKEKEN